jgi:ankyrin repeat protein
MARIHSAVRSGKSEEVTACLAVGADFNAFSVHHLTPLMIAAQEGCLKIVDLLLKADANPDLAHPNGRTALHMAASQGHTNIVKRLLASGANPDAVSEVGDTPMIEAAHLCHAEVMAVLREYGADPTPHDREGLTADEWLAQGGIPGRYREELPTFADEDAEAFVRKLMGEGLSAEEYAASHGRHILVCSFGRYRFRDAKMQQWIHRVAEIVLSPDLLAQCEEQYLVGAELEDARKHRARLARLSARQEQRKARL